MTRILIAVCVLSLAPAQAQERAPAARQKVSPASPPAPAKGVREAAPATAAEALRVIDLRTLTLLPKAEPLGSGTMARLYYQAPGETKAAFATQAKTLLSAGWKQLPHSYISDQSASATFARDEFLVSLSVSPAEEGQVSVSLANHGNIDVTRLPLPPHVKALYSSPINVGYVTDAPPEETAEAVRKLLTARGWIPYGGAGDVAYYRQNAIRLSARVLSAPGQGGRTVLSFSTEQLSLELPVPENAIDPRYTDEPIQLSFDSPNSYQEVHDYYKTALAPAGWKGTTDGPVKLDFRHFFIFRNQAQDMLEATLTTVEGKTRVFLVYSTAAQVAELERLAKERAAKAAAANKPQPKPKLAITLPANAKGVENSGHELEFTVAAGKAQAAVEALRKQLLAAGFTEEQATLEPMFGTVSLKKDGHSITLTYVDTGILAPEVSISAFGWELTTAISE